jgi:hypothetical protein
MAECVLNHVGVRASVLTPIGIRVGMSPAYRMAECYDRKDDKDIERYFKRTDDRWIMTEVDILYLIDDFCHGSIESKIQFRSFLKNQHRYRLVTLVHNWLIWH